MTLIRKNIVPIIITLLINIVLDRLTKLIAIIYLKGKSAISFINNIIILEYTENNGAFLSLGSNWPIVVKYIILLIIPIIVCLAVLWYCICKEKNKSRSILLATIVSGGLGNLFDRLFNRYYVVDFMNFGIGQIRTGVLNVADLSVTFGVVALIIYELKMNGRTDKKE